MCVISSFYNVFVQFSFHSQFLNYSAEENPCCIFSGAYNIKLVNSFILVWHSDYELSCKTQKPFFILKESSKSHNINYRAKNYVVMIHFPHFILIFVVYLNTLMTYQNFFLHWTGLSPLLLFLKPGYIGLILIYSICQATILSLVTENIKRVVGLVFIFSLT